ncbi:MAG: S41 family peptidase [Flavobacteriaceae bacterium]
MKRLKITGILIFLITLSCSKDDGVDIPDTVNPDPNAGVEVQDFMWKAMNYWYFWQAEVPNLADGKFPNTAEGSKTYTDFLLLEDNPAAFFSNQLLFGEDRFSFFNEDYRVLTQSLSGIRKSNGVQFGLVGVTGSNDIYGYVRYIIAGSDASNKAIKRGDVFTGVNGQALTRDNYIGLLFGSNDTYTLNMASVVNGELTANNVEVTLTKQEGLQEDPIYLDKIFEIQGKKIGYLVYTQFLNEFDEQLNDIFGRFVSGGVTELVLDLRYNPGGSVNTTVLLGSMIHGTNTNDVFLNARYNDKYQAILANNNEETRRFFKNKTTAGNAVHTLNLNKVYVLTTNTSASASELVINGLDPHMDVVRIGETTRGKNEFSVTLVDDRNSNWGPYVYNPARADKIPANNQWAIQPLIGRNENADGFSDYTAGLVPDIELEEDLANLGVLGDQNEPLLAKAIEQITGATGKRDFTVQMPVKAFTGSEMFTPTKDNMWIDRLDSQE